MDKIYDLVQDYSNSIANALESLQSCSKPSKSRCTEWTVAAFPSLSDTQPNVSWAAELYTTRWSPGRMDAQHLQHTNIYVEEELKNVC